MLNPYELLGVEPDTPIVQVRKNYYALALLAHPDVGGTTEDMVTLKACYDWICQQWRLNHAKIDYEKTKQNFEDFLKDQLKDGIPPVNLRELCTESYGLTRIIFEDMIPNITDSYQKEITFQYVSHELQLSLWKNETIPDLKAFVQQKTEEILHKKEFETASIPHGYGKDTPYETTEMVLYQEPDPNLSKTNGREIQLPQQLEDYSNETLCDYKKAFQWPLPEKEWTDTSTLEELLLAKEIERKL